MLVENLGNSGEFYLGHITGMVGNLFVKFMQNGWGLKQIVSQENGKQNNLNILNKNGKVGKFASEKSWEPYSFDWEMAEDEDLKSWERVGKCHELMV